MSHPLIPTASIAAIGQGTVLVPDFGGPVQSADLFKLGQPLNNALTVISGAMFSGTGSLIVTGSNVTINVTGNGEIAYTDAGQSTLVEVQSGFTQVLTSGSGGSQQLQLFNSQGTWSASDGVHSTAIKQVPSTTGAQLQVTGTTAFANTVSTAGTLAVGGLATAISGFFTSAGTVTAPSASFNSVFSMLAQFLGSITTVNSAHVFSASDTSTFVVGNTSGGTHSDTLPPAAAGQRVMFFLADGTVGPSASRWTIAAHAGDTVMGQPSVTLSGSYQGMMLVSNGTSDWVGIKSFGQGF